MQGGRPERLRAAVEAARLGWQERKAELRDEVGTLEKAALWRASKKPTDRKTHAIAFAIAIEKTLLLAGDATERVEFSSAEERREWIKRKQDELASRRQARAGQ